MATRLKVLNFDHLIFGQTAHCLINQQQNVGKEQRRELKLKFHQGHQVLVLLIVFLVLYIFEDT
jgi:hypothetical protein